MDEDRETETLEKPARAAQANSAPIDVKAIMQSIRARVKKDLAGQKPHVPKFVPPASQLFEGSTSRIVDREELNYLNAHWNDWLLPWEVSSHRPILGPLVVKAKTALREYILNVLLPDYFRSEKDFQLQVVRYLNANAYHVDQRDGDIFWQLVRKLDTDIQMVNERMDLLHQEGASALDALNVDTASRLQKLERHTGELLELGSKLQQSLQHQQQTISCILHDLAAAQGNLPENQSEKPLPLSSDYNSESLARFAELANCFLNSEGKILDLGCADKALLKSLKQSGIEGAGVALSLEVMQAGEKEGLSVSLGQPEAYLANLEDQSLGGIFFSTAAVGADCLDLEELLKHAAQKVKSGGIFVFDCSSPKTMRSAACLPSLQEVETALRNNSFVPIKSVIQEDAANRKKLEQLAIPEYMPPNWQEILLTINKNSAMLNNALFGAEFYVVAKKT